MLSNQATQTHTFVKLQIGSERKHLTSYWGAVREQQYNHTYSIQSFRRGCDGGQGVLNRIM